MKEKILETLDKHVEILSKRDTLTDNDISFLMNYLTKIETEENNKNFREKLNLMVQGGLG